MLTGLKIGNFKAFGETQHIPIRPLTLIFGANSSGKSSIIESLLLANHALETGSWDVQHPRLSDDSVDLRGFPHFLHRHQAAEPLVMGYEVLGQTGARLLLHVGTSQPGGDAAPRGGKIAIQTAEIWEGGKPVFQFTRSGDETFRCSRVQLDHAFVHGLISLALMKSQQLAETGLDGLESFKERFAGFSDPLIFAEELTQLGREFEASIKAASFRLYRRGLRNEDGRSREWLRGQAQTNIWINNDDFLEYWLLRATRTLIDVREAQAAAVCCEVSERLELLTSIFVSLIDTIRFLGPIRSVPPRHLLMLGSGSAQGVRSDVAAWKELCNQEQAQRSVNRWIGLGWLGMPYQLKLRPIVYEDNPAERPGLPDIQFEEVSTGTRLNCRDLGFGVTQLLPVLVVAGSASNRLIAIEQAELHLHPAMQAELGDVFIESALGERRNTFLLETHSEHLILRILRRVRETTEGKLPEGATPVRPEDVSVVYVQPGPKGAEVIELPVTPDGDFSRPWPNGFFAERFQELP